MVKKKWIRVKWAGLSSVRYFFLTLPDGQRIIVDHWSGFRFLHYIPFVRRTQKFNAYFIPVSEDISGWENILINENDMVWGAAKVAGGSFVLKLLAGGIISGGIIGLFKLLGKPIVNILKYFHIPSLIFIIIFSFSLWWLTNFISKQNIKKKIPMEKFQLEKEVIKVQFKDILVSIGIGIFIVGIIFFLLILGTKYDSNIIVTLIILTWLGFWGYDGILGTADLYIIDDIKEKIDER